MLDYDRFIQMYNNNKNEFKRTSLGIWTKSWNDEQNFTVSKVVWGVRFYAAYDELRGKRIWFGLLLILSLIYYCMYINVNV